VGDPVRSLVGGPVGTSVSGAIVGIGVGDPVGAMYVIVGEDVGDPVGAMVGLMVGDPV